MAEAEATFVASDVHGEPPGQPARLLMVDFKLVSDDAVYRDDEGTEHVLAWGKLPIGRTVGRS